MRDENHDEECSPASRKIQLLLELLYRKRISVSDYYTLWGKERRTFQRDLAELRGIGKDLGFFELSDLERGTRRGDEDEQFASITLREPKLANLGPGGRKISLLAAIGRALGAPLVAELGLDANPSDDNGFLQFQVPEGTGYPSMTETYQTLKDAWAERPRGVVAFAYSLARGERRNHQVEPYLVVIRTGNAYLIGYDRIINSWDMFALNRFLSSPHRVGSTLEVRKVPPEYEHFGLGETTEPRYEPVKVVVEISSEVPISVINANIQPGHHIEQSPDGSTRVTLYTDERDAAKWAFRFGPAAAIVSPPRAIHEARHMLQVMLKLSY